MESENNTSSVLRDKALRSLQQYVDDTLEYIDTVRKFSGTQTVTNWRLERNAELSTLKIITENLSKEPAKELDAVLEKTVEGMEKLTDFLDAVEKLAVTSLHVFTAREEIMRLSLGICLQRVEDSISAARLVCPLLLQFKRDAGVFFRPSLHNVAVFVAKLDKYLDTAEKICTTMGNSSAIRFEGRRVEPPLVQFGEDSTPDVLENIIAHIKKLADIRVDQNFRLVYLFQEKSISGFGNQFREKKDRMLQFLDDMEDSAARLDRMKMGSKISSIAGSSVGVIGGVLSIVGLALAPVTAGVSLGLTLGGVGLGVTSGVNSAVTTVMEIAVNKAQKERASEGLQSFMQDVNSIQACLDEVTNQTEEILGKEYGDFVSGAMVVGNVVTIGRGIDIIVDSLDDVALAAAKGAGVSKLARAGFISVNALFLGFDIFTICKDSISLAKGDKSEVSQFIRARAALLRSELDAWQTMYESLNQGMLESERSKSTLEQSLNLYLKENMKNSVKQGSQNKCIIYDAFILFVIFVIFATVYIQWQRR